MTLLRKNKSRVTHLALWSAAALLCVYCVFQIVTLDAYGQCYKPGNFWLCLDGWFDRGSSKFKRLVSDEELIERFQQHRAEFDQVVAYTMKPKLDFEFSPEMLGKQEWKQQLGLYWIKRHYDSSEPKICLRPFGAPLARCQEVTWKWREFELQADVTGLIDERFWPYSNLVKYYAYYPDEQVFEDGLKGGMQWQLHPDLDKDWPAGWPVPNNPPRCLARRLEAHWYLKLCRNDIGG